MKRVVSVKHHRLAQSPKTSLLMTLITLIYTLRVVIRRRICFLCKTTTGPKNMAGAANRNGANTAIKRGGSYLHPTKCHFV